MWGIGASLDAEDGGEGWKVESDFKGVVSIWNPPEDLRRIPVGDMVPLGLIVGDADLVRERGGGDVAVESAGDCGGGLSGSEGGVNASSLASDVDSGDLGREG